MTTTERKHPITSAQVNGYEVPSLPTVLPPRQSKRSSLRDAMRAAFEAVYNDDPVFRERFGSLTNSDAQTSNYHVDKSLAAQTLYRWIEKNRSEALTQKGEHAIGWIKAHGIPDLLKEWGMDRQTRYRAALVDGRAPAPAAAA